MLTAQALGYAPDGPLDFGLDRAALIERRAGARRDAAARDRAAREGMAGRALDRAWRSRSRRADYSVVLPWGNEAERRRSVEIAAAVPNAQVPDLQPLDQVARMIARAAFVVGVDTGLLHLAAALGVPLVAIFVGTEPGQHGPLGVGQDRDRRRARRTCRRSRKCAPPWSGSRLSAAGACASVRCAISSTCSAEMFAHAAMVHDAAGRLVARLAVELLDGLLHGGGDRIERRPMPRAGRAENADGRGAERGRDVQQARVVRDRDVRRGKRQDRVAQIRAGEIARDRARDRG